MSAVAGGALTNPAANSAATRTAPIIAAPLC
jgi:hypothetical protein